MSDDMLLCSHGSSTADFKCSVCTVDDLRSRLSETERERDHWHQTADAYHDAQVLADRANSALIATEAKLAAAENDCETLEARLDEAVGLLRRWRKETVLLVHMQRGMREGLTLVDCDDVTDAFLSLVAPQPEVKSQTVKEWLGWDAPPTKGEK